MDTNDWCTRAVDLIPGFSSLSKKTLKRESIMTGTLNPEDHMTFAVGRTLNPEDHMTFAVGGTLNPRVIIC